MSDHIIDCCSLLNLYTGWGRLTEIRDLGWNWHICDAVLKEAEYTREFGADGTPVMVQLDMEVINTDVQLIPASLTTAAEIEDYVNFASEIDDGEAQAIAIAKHRGFILLTDDNKAAALAVREGVSTTSTASILRAWASLSAENELRLPDIIHRITTLARFRPRLNSTHFDWWNGYLAK